MAGLSAGLGLLTVWAFGYPFGFVVIIGLMGLVGLAINAAIVSWRTALDHHSPNVDHIEVDAAHPGMAFNPKIWSLVMQSLERDS